MKAARLDLISNKQRLEEDSRVKENSLKIDQQKCMTLRYKHLPPCQVMIMIISL